MNQFFTASSKLHVILLSSESWENRDLYLKQTNKQKKRDSQFIQNRADLVGPLLAHKTVDTQQGIDSTWW